MAFFKNFSHFLYLIRIGIGTQPMDGGNSIASSGTVDWNAIESLANTHGLSAVLLDGVEKMPVSMRPPKEMLLHWIGNTLQSYESRYEKYRRTIAEMAAFYNAHGFKMMILKGYACSLDWPKPEHRPCGDIDIWQFGQQQEADDIVTKEKGIKISSSHQHHTEFLWRDFLVENHYEFINIHHHKSNVAMEKLFKELGKDDSYYVELLGEKVYVPSPNLHALFLLKHNMIHFAAEGITLRNLLDWGFFVKAHGDEVDWEWLEEILVRFGMKPLYDIFNAICVGDLGFDVKYFHDVQFDPELKDRVLNEILSPEYPIEAPRCLFSRMLFKYRRWKGNEWKHKLCYKESMWSAFWSGVWNHLLKPSSI